MWPQNYTPLGGSLATSAVVAAAPVFAMLYMLGVRRMPAWKSALSGLVAAVAVALLVYRMPLGLAFSAAAYGAAYGLFPIGLIVFGPIMVYRVAMEAGKFEIIKDSLGGLTQDRRLQALLIAFVFSAFLEGAAGFGTPVAVASTMLVGLGFPAFYAAGLCLLSNTAPVAFGSIGTPVVALSTVTNLPLLRLSSGVGRLISPISLIMPAYLILVMGGWKSFRKVFPAVLISGVSSATVQWLVADYMGPYLANMLSSVVTLVMLVLLLLVWKPKDHFKLEGDQAAQAVPKKHSASELIWAWSPYAILVLMVVLSSAFKAELNKVTINFAWPGLHQMVSQGPPVMRAVTPYAAMYKFDWLAAAGTASVLASVLAAIVLGLSPARFGKVLWATVKQVYLSEVTIAAVVALAFVMNYSGATGTLGLVFAATGVMFPFFSALLGWLGVFLTGSDTSANALFGNLQVVTADKLGFSPVLMAASNSAGGVMGKMISLQSIAVAAAATGIPPSKEAGLFRLTLRHSILLASAVGLITLFYAYVMPSWAP